MDRITGIIKKLNPVMNNGEQETWKNDRGMIYYKFYVTIGDTEGTILSSKTTPSWKIGTKVDIAYKKNSSGNISFNNLKIVNDEEKKPGTTTGNRYYAPEGVKESCMGMAQRIARIMFEGVIKINPEKAKESPKNIESILNYGKFFYDWIIMDGLTRDACSIRWFALEEAVFNMQFPTLEIKSKDAIIANAEILLNQVKSVNEEKKNESSELL